MAPEIAAGPPPSPGGDRDERPRPAGSFDQLVVASGLENDRHTEHIRAMGVSEKWTEVLKCPHCALIGTADLFQNGRGIVQALRLPAGFKVVSSEYGDTFDCEACNLPARTTLK